MMDRVNLIVGLVLIVLGFLVGSTLVMVCGAVGAAMGLVGLLLDRKPSV